MTKIRVRLFLAAIVSCEVASFARGSESDVTVSEEISQSDTTTLQLGQDVAEPGGAQAFEDLARSQLNGVGGEQNAETLQWLRECAERGEAWGQNMLGFMFAKGQGVEQDYAEAVKWYRLAAEQNDPIAQSNLGALYLTGQGVPVDERQGITLLNKAAAQGDADAKSKLLKFGETKRLLQLRSAWVTILICAVIGLGSLVVLKIAQPGETVSQPEAG